MTAAITFVVATVASIIKAVFLALGLAAATLIITAAAVAYFATDAVKEIYCETTSENIAELIECNINFNS